MTRSKTQDRRRVVGGRTSRRSRGAARRIPAHGQRRGRARAVDAFIEEELKADEGGEGVTGWTTFLGETPPTFTLGYTPSPSESGYCELMVHTSGTEVVEDLMDRMRRFVLERFPNVRLASVENGSEFLPDLFRKLEQSRTRMPGYYGEDPSVLFRRNVWINPFWEDDVNEVAELMGPERVIFGSDWPHMEGMPEPLDYLPEVAEFTEADRRRIMRDNTRELNELRPA